MLAEATSFLSYGKDLIGSQKINIILKVVKANWHSLDDKTQKNHVLSCHFVSDVGIK